VAVAIPVLVPVIVPNVAVVFVGTRKTSSKLKGVVRLALLSGLRVNPSGLKFAFEFVKMIPLPPQPDPADCEPVVVPQKPCSVFNVVTARAGEAAVRRQGF